MPETPLSRRHCLKTAAALAAPVAGWLWPQAAWAGGQLEEPLADSVRTALSSAVAGSGAPPELEFASTAARMSYLRWLVASSDKLAKRKPDLQARREFLQTVWYESKRAGLDVSMVMGLILPFWMRLIGDGDIGKLFHMQTNLRFGCVILRHYMDREKGDAYMALGRYNGSRGQPQYPNAVFGAQRRWLVEEPQSV